VRVTRERGVLIAIPNPVTSHSALGTGAGARCLPEAQSCWMCNEL
jgi:hypothetical protein